MCLVIFVAAVSARADATTRPTYKVAVVPFSVHGDGGHEWLGRAMQEGLAMGLGNGSGVSGVIVAGATPADAAGAMAMAQNAGVNAVIFGSIQVANDRLRVNGQILWLDGGQAIASLRADGAVADLFNVEDILAARVARVFAPATRSNAVAAGPAPTLTLVGPTIGGGPSRYYDGDLMAQLAPKDTHRDDYNRYYYQTGDTSALGYSCGAYGGIGGWGIGGGCSFGGFGGGCSTVIATPTSGW